MWRFLKGKRHLRASAPLYTNWRTAIGKQGLESGLISAPFGRSTEELISDLCPLISVYPLSPNLYMYLMADL